MTRRPAKTEIIDGHPVPYSLTILRPRRVSKRRACEIAQAWLDRYKPGMRVVRADGNYVFYSD